MKGDLLDLILGLLLILVAARGYRRGLLVGTASLIGFVGGAFIGTRIANPIASSFTHGRTAALVGLVIVLVCAVLVQELLVHAATLARTALRLTPLRFFDGLGGAALSVAAMLFVSWLLGVAAEQSPYAGLARQARDSRILTAVDAVLPSSLYTTFAAFLRLVESQDFPPVFAGLSPPAAPQVAPPQPGDVPLSVINADAPSIVKIIAQEPECGQQTEGSGFVYAPNHVLTNAHVVAGSHSVRIVSDGTGTSLDLPATVVFYDPNRDVAVLYVPGLSRRDLTLGGSATTGTAAEVAGYPENGPFTAVPARVRAREEVSGPNIYSDATVTRSVYVLYASVHPGNSGGPLIATNGEVYGIVFAASTTDPRTGYALTAGEVAGDASAGASGTSPVSTQGCS
ncbi:MAG: MarP family serine protease [Mycobacteriales bacterium]